MIEAVEIYGRDWPEVIASLTEQGVHKTYQSVVSKAIGISNKQSCKYGGAPSKLFLTRMAQKIYRTREDKDDNSLATTRDANQSNWYEIVSSNNNDAVPTDFSTVSL